jgi:LysM repeat protein/uncharacterized protein YkwD
MKIVFILTFLLGATLSASAQKDTKTTYTVLEGENLYRIALRHKVSVAKLCEWNAIQPTEALEAGKELVVTAPNISPKSEQPAARLAKTAKQTGETHRVQTGETVAKIANTYGYTEERFRLFNNLHPQEKVAPGRVLKSCDCTCSAANKPAAPAAISDVSKPAPAPKTTAPKTTAPEQQKAVAEEPVNTGKPNSTLTVPKKTAETPVAEADKAAEAKAVKEASTSSFMSAEEMAMVDEVNLARTSPKIYIQYVEEYIKSLEENNDNDGISAARELIEQLTRMEPCKSLSTSECVFMAAKKHAEQEKPKGDIDHQGKDGLFAWDRVPKECPMMTDGGENLVGGGKTVRKSVLLLLVDSGIPNRGHRNTMLDPKWTFIGCYKIGLVGTMPNYWIQNFGM